MRKDSNKKPNPLNRILILWLFLVFFSLNCSNVPTIGKEIWTEHSFAIDDAIKVYLKLPSGISKTDDVINQYFYTNEGIPQRLFIANYDLGKGRDSDFFFTRITGSMVRLSKNNEFSEDISTDEIKSRLYMSRPSAEREFIFEGDYVSSDHQWLKIVLATGHRRGVIYAAPIHDRYVLILTMSIFGENSNETRLYQQRLGTLVEMLNSVRVEPLEQ